MKLRMTSRHIASTAPVATFEGDVHLPAGSYEQLMTGGYASVAEYAKAGAAAAGVTLDTVTEERWRRLASATHYIDEFIDTADEPAKARRLYEEGLQAALEHTDTAEALHAVHLPENVNPLLPASVVALHSSLESASQHQREQLGQAARTIHRAASTKAATRDIATYITTLQQESDATSALFEHIATPTVATQPAHRALVEVVRHAMRVAVMLDSAFDLREDYQEGITAVTPTWRHMARLALAALPAAHHATKFGDNLHITWAMAREVRPYVAHADKVVANHNHLRYNCE